MLNKLSKVPFPLSYNSYEWSVTYLFSHFSDKSISYYACLFALQYVQVNDSIAKADRKLWKPNILYIFINIVYIYCK